jgi:hypothetical protein
MKDRKTTDRTKDKSHLQAEALTDLPLADERIEEAKGGARPMESLSINFTKITFNTTSM